MMSGVPRTRSYSKLLLPNPCPVVLQQYAGTPRTSPIYGVDPSCVPPRLIGSTNTTYPIEPLVDASSITDEVIAGRGIKNVTHYRKKTWVYPRLDHASGTLGWLHTSAFSGVSSLPYYPTRYLNSPIPYRQAWGNLGSSLLFDPINLGWSDLGSKIGMPPDRLGELPARVVSKLDAIHASTILYEAREFPQLYQLFTRRGAIRQGLGLLSRLARSGAGVNNPVFGSTMKRFAKLYREGHLGIEYGLMPTIREMQNVHRELRKRQTRKREQFSVTIPQVLNKGKVTQHASGSTYENAIITEDLECRRIDGARVSYERPVSNLVSKMDNFERDFIGANPLGLAWEILPASFMVDWLLSVDDILDTLWLNNQTKYVVQYWTSVKIQHAARFSLAYLDNITGSGVFGVSTKIFKQGPTIQSNVKSYSRTRREPPSPLDSARLRGDKVYNLYLAGLIALGLRR